MEDFNIIDDSKNKEFLRFLGAISIGVVVALTTVVFLGLLSI
jgi:hypothetical protein